MEIAAARHGARAARIDATPHSTIPCDYAHHIWSLDGFQAPVYVRVFSERARGYVATKVSVLIAIDHKSRVIVGVHVADPARRQVTGGYDHRDVLALLFNAAFPELASAGTCDYAGHLPAVLRWDRAPSQRILMERLRRVGISVPDLESNSPHQRGMIESPVSPLKNACARIKGYAEKWLVAEGTSDDPRKTRTTAAATLLREPTRLPISVHDLLTVDELAAEMDQIVAWYNHEHQHSALGCTPDLAYTRHFDHQRARNGHDLLQTVEPVSCSVTKAGLPHRRVHFAVEHAGRTLPLGAQVVFRPDPLLRGVFAEAWGDLVFLPTLDRWARETTGADVAISQSEAAREASDNAGAARERHRQEVLGAEAVARADAVLAAATAPKRRGRPRGSKNKKKSDATVIPLNPATQKPEADQDDAKPRAPRRKALPPPPQKVPAQGIFAGLNALGRVVPK